MTLRKPNIKDSPPVLSHEFMIQNHADIISCVCMVIFMGLIPQFTNPLASSIIFVQYNKTVELEELQQDTPSSRVDTKPLPETYYTHGWFDTLNIIFYGLVWIIIHALLQEYIWERTAKRLKLSKVKLSKYYDSGCLVVFYLVSVVWGIDYIVKEGLVLKWSLLWEGYPHTDMGLSLKFYMLNQMAFWLHCYPELYFMKVKKDKMYSKLVLYTSSLLLIAGAYLMMLQRFAVILLVLHYSVEFLFHASRLLHYHGKDDVAIPGFKVWRVLFVLVRILTVIISVLTLWFGLGKIHDQLQQEAVERATREEPTAVPPPPSSDEDNVTVAAATEDEKHLIEINFTEWPYRLLGLSFVLFLQLWIGWTFLNYQMERSGSTDKQKQSDESTAKKVKGATKTNNRKGTKAKTS